MSIIKYLIASRIQPQFNNDKLFNYDIIEASNENKALEYYNIKHDLNLNFFWSIIIKEIDND